MVQATGTQKVQGLTMHSRRAVRRPVNTVPARAESTRVLEDTVRSPYSHVVPQLMLFDAPLRQQISASAQLAFTQRSH